MGEHFLIRETVRHHAIGLLVTGQGLAGAGAEQAVFRARIMALFIQRLLKPGDLFAVQFGCRNGGLVERAAAGNAVRQPTHRNGVGF